VVVDSREQCATIGELHHALDRETLRSPSEAAELAEIVAGTKPGRQSSGEITVFDSTGVALEDVAAAAATYEEALRSGRGKEWDVFGSSRRRNGTAPPGLLMDLG
jgi:ornithine cyclodeaminase/alanine dehydrogenase-like protein (mu-crystallin family)